MSVRLSHADVTDRQNRVWAADPNAPDMMFCWQRVDGEYVIRGEVKTTYSPYYVDAFPWPHCGKCDDRLRKCGERARCGRQHVATVRATYSDLPPCERCQETGRIWCYLCCEQERNALAFEEIKRLFVSRDVFNLQTVMINNDGWCYFVSAVGTRMIKIGTSLEPDKRIRELQNSSPIPLRSLGLFPGGRAMEKRAHSWLREHRAHGEWFHDGQELRDLLRDMRVAHERIDDYQRIVELRPQLRRCVWEDILQ